MSRRESHFTEGVLIDTTPLPESIPPVDELGASSAPLMSAAYFIGARCKAYNDDYMKCKTEAYGTGEFDCMREGRKVTRCAASVIKDINTSCLDSFRAHWECLDNNNHQLWHCRFREQVLNACVFDRLGLVKTIPGTPSKSIPVHLRDRQIYSDKPTSRRLPQPFFDSLFRTGDQSTASNTSSSSSSSPQKLSIYNAGADQEWQAIADARDKILTREAESKFKSTDETALQTELKRIRDDRARREAAWTAKKKEKYILTPEDFGLEEGSSVDRKALFESRGPLLEQMSLQREEKLRAMEKRQEEVAAAAKKTATPAKA